jgi:adenylate cyclase
MPDIFISYSRRDTEQALQLVERLRAEGMTVWIDQHGIEAATIWSEEIVNAIDECSAFVVLLSEHSVASSNVAKEVHVACEANKRVLPIALDDVRLSNELRYHLAGIQRVAFSQFDAIIQALSSHGVEAVARKGYTPRPQRKSLMILPFQDLSPTQDNGWFADGIVSELIGALSNIKSIKLTDVHTTNEFKRYQGTLPNYAREMMVRYFVQGNVRKFGVDIKISAWLLDIDTGDHLWQDSIKGKMEDVFDIQEQVASRVVAGLKLHLGSEERAKLFARETNNVEAYELLLRASNYYGKQTQDGYRLAIQLASEALTLDPNYAHAMQIKASSLLALFRSYEKSAEYLQEAEELAKRGLELKPEYWRLYGVLSRAYLFGKRLPEAEEAALEYVRLAPDDALSHFYLAHFYAQTRRPELAIPEYEKTLELNPESNAHWNLVLACEAAGDVDRTMMWAERGVGHHSKHLRLVPDDEHMRVHYAALLLMINEPSEALTALEPLRHKNDLDSSTLYDVCCLYCRLGDRSAAMNALQRAFSAGFADAKHLRIDRDLDPLRELPEFNELQQKLEEELKSATAKNLEQKRHV